jgi:hypothetical protein
MKKITQIVALTDRGVNMIWNEDISDFVAYSQEVPSTVLNELKNARDKAAEYSGIIKVWVEVIDAETNQLIEVYK